MKKIVQFLTGCILLLFTSTGVLTAKDKKRSKKSKSSTKLVIKLPSRLELKAYKVKKVTFSGSSFFECTSHAEIQACSKWIGVVTKHFKHIDLKRRSTSRGIAIPIDLTHDPYFDSKKMDFLYERIILILAYCHANKTKKQIAQELEKNFEEWSQCEKNRNYKQELIMLSELCERLEIDVYRKALIRFFFNVIKNNKDILENGFWKHIPENMIKDLKKKLQKDALEIPDFLINSKNYESESPTSSDEESQEEVASKIVIQGKDESRIVLTRNHDRKAFQACLKWVDRIKNQKKSSVITVDLSSEEGVYINQKRLGLFCNYVAYNYNATDSDPSLVDYTGINEKDFITRLIDYLKRWDPRDLSMLCDIVQALQIPVYEKALIQFFCNDIQAKKSLLKKDFWGYIPEKFRMLLIGTLQKDAIKVPTFLRNAGDSKARSKTTKKKKIKKSRVEKIIFQGNGNFQKVLIREENKQSFEACLKWVGFVKKQQKKRVMTIDLSAFNEQQLVIFYDHVIHRGNGPSLIDHATKREETFIKELVTFFEKWDSRDLSSLCYVVQVLEINVYKKALIQYLYLDIKKRESEEEKDFVRENSFWKHVPETMRKTLIKKLQDDEYDIPDCLEYPEDYDTEEEVSVEEEKVLSCSSPAVSSSKEESKQEEDDDDEEYEEELEEEGEEVSEEDVIITESDEESVSGSGSESDNEQEVCEDGEAEYNHAYTHATDESLQAWIYTLDQDPAKLYAALHGIKDRALQEIQENEDLQDFFDSCPENVFKMFLRFLCEYLPEKKLNDSVMDSYPAIKRLREVSLGTFNLTGLVDELNIYESKLSKHEAMYSLILVVCFLYEKQIIRLTVHNAGLTRFPCVLLPNLSALSLQGNKLKDISVEHFTCLTSLNICGNQFSVLPVLKNQLRVLDISDNMLWGDITFSGELDSLHELNLSRNIITTVSNIEAFKDLENLDLSYNKLERLPRNISELTKLQNLNASYNLLKEVVPLNARFAWLKKVDLSHNELTEIGLELMNLMWKSMDLNVSHNQITGFLKEIRFRKSYKIRKLNLSHNKLKEFPITITDLEMLDLSHNKLKVAPQCNVSSDYKRRSINFSYNELEDISNLNDLDVKGDLFLVGNRKLIRVIMRNDLIREGRLKLQKERLQKNKTHIKMKTRINKDCRHYGIIFNEVERLREDLINKKNTLKEKQELIKTMVESNEKCKKYKKLHIRQNRLRKQERLIKNKKKLRELEESSNNCKSLKKIFAKQEILKKQIQDQEKKLNKKEESLIALEEKSKECANLRGLLDKKIELENEDLNEDLFPYCLDYGWTIWFDGFFLDGAS